MRRPAIETVYIPKFFGNRELDESEQVKVEMTIATIKERKRYSSSKTSSDTKGKNITFEMNNKPELAVMEKVTNILCYEDEKGSPIDTAEKLIADCSEYSIELVNELFSHIMGYDLKEDEEGEE